MQSKKYDLTAPLYEKAYEIATKVSAVYNYMRKSLEQGITTILL